jgi:hypothetical protein
VTSTAFAVDIVSAKIAANHMKNTIPNPASTACQMAALPCSV